MDRKHFLKGSEAREQALLQRDLDTQTLPEVTPSINTQTAATGYVPLVCASISHKEKKTAACKKEARNVLWFGCICVFASNRKGKSHRIWDIRYASSAISFSIALICIAYRAPFIKKIQIVSDGLHGKETVFIESCRVSSCLHVFYSGSCCCVLRKAANIELWCNVQALIWNGCAHVIGSQFAILQLYHQTRTGPVRLHGAVLELGRELIGGVGRVKGTGGDVCAAVAWRRAHS